MAENNKEEITNVNNKYPTLRTELGRLIDKD